MMGAGQHFCLVSLRNVTNFDHFELARIVFSHEAQTESTNSTLKTFCPTVHEQQLHIAGQCAHAFWHHTLHCCRHPTCNRRCIFPSSLTTVKTYPLHQRDVEHKCQQHAGSLRSIASSMSWHR